MQFVSACTKLNCVNVKHCHSIDFLKSFYEESVIEEARFNTFTKTNFTAACLSIEVVKNKEDTYTCESLLPCSAGAT